MSHSPFWLPGLTAGLLMVSASTWAGPAAAVGDEDAAQSESQQLQNQLEQRRQFREKRLQQAIANGDLSESEAEQLRQRWMVRDSLILKWRSGQLSPTEREQLQESWRQQWKSLTPEQRERFRVYMGDHGPTTMVPPPTPPQGEPDAIAPKNLKRFTGKPSPERPPSP